MDAGTFRAVAYESLLDGIEHLALVHGDPASSAAAAEGVLVRVHSECLTGDSFKSRRCDCGAQLERSLEMIADEGVGVLVYLRGHEGRGIGLGHKLRAYKLQENGRDTVDANLELGLPVDSREYGIGAAILADLGVTRLRLITNNPHKYDGLDGFDLEIVGRVGATIAVTPDNLAYLRTKRDRMGHLLHLPPTATGA
jgi:3,4-dihydroxy 2-butanone 4-phosphate synthase/GTP cyclohydrolase II